MNKILNFLGHKIAPLIKAYRSFVVKKQFKLGVLMNENINVETLLFHHNQICQNFEYRDQSWDSIKHIGQLMWNDLFCNMPFLKKKNSIESNLPIENSNMSMFTNNILIECGQVNPMRAFIVGFCEASREVVGEGTRINCKPWLACLVSDGIPYV